MIVKENPLVSVVIPVYNAARFLHQAIDSVLGQSYRNIELILVDDCSTDDSLEIMRTYAARDDRVLVLPGEQNQGVARARNRGIARARGEYVAFLDSDDAWTETKLEEQLALLMEKQADIVYSAVDFVDENNRVQKVFQVPAGTDYDEMLVRCFFICSSVVVRASLVREHPFRPEFYHEDLLLWLELLALPVKAVGVQKVLVHYRQISGSRSNNKANAAKHRWKIYRQALGMNVFQSARAFVRYAYWGVVKYYL